MHLVKVKVQTQKLPPLRTKIRVGILILLGATSYSQDLKDY